MITLLACSLAAGAVDTTSERVQIADWIFFSGLFVLVVHAAVFGYRSVRREKKSHWIFWSVSVLSVFIIPVAILNIIFLRGPHAVSGLAMFRHSCLYSRSLDLPHN